MTRLLRKLKLKNPIQIIIRCAFYLISGSALLAHSTQPLLPDVVDNSRSDYFPDIGDQGNVNASDWFAIVYYQMTFAYNRQQQHAATRETIFSPQFGYPLLNNGQPYPSYLLVSDVYHFIAKHGSPSVADLPYLKNDIGYKTWPATQKIWRQAINYRTAGHTSFTFKNRVKSADYSFDDYNKYFYEIKKLLSQGELLVIQTYPDFDQPGLLKRTADNPDTDKDNDIVDEFIIVHGIDGYHRTMAIVGYNDYIWVDFNNDGERQDDETGAFKIADSAGKNADKHNQGFIWMAYSTVKDSIFQHRINRLQLRKDYKPETLAYLTLSGRERDKIRFQFGRSVGKKIDENSSVFNPVGVGFTPGAAERSLIAGADCSFDGSNNSSMISFAFDLTDINDNNMDGWYLRIDTGGSTIHVEEFQIVDQLTGNTYSYTNLPTRLTKGEKLLFITK